MKNKYLLSLLAALGFSGCSNNNVWDEPCYYGPGPDWTPDVKLTTQVQNEDEDTINGIRVVASYKNQNDSLITDTAYTESHEIDNYTVSGIATSTLKFKEYPPKNSEIYLEYTDVDGEKNGAYQQKTIKMQELGQDRKVTLIKEEKRKKRKLKNETYHSLISASMAGFRDIPPDETRKNRRTSPQTTILGMYITLQRTLSPLW
ncbi:radical SAM-associated putative lipoprotein [Bacteroides faecis]|uniref:radical SAM-associated putative lipoprotein n=1 Tax=Bacteroides faecis TaxID=674529 RepID=UPI00286E8DFC|nr:radical SAM-associated putative lipoprotein [Bacteroides faecis]MCS2236581.1 radical SAM-associated putative lipoprotein [Bacteroides faecis]